MLQTVIASISQYKSILTLILAIILPRVLPRLLPFVLRRRDSPRSPSEPLSLTFKVIVGLHSLYQVYRLFLPPFDLFKAHHIPLLAPQDIVRSRLLGRRARDSDLSTLADTHPLLELLLQKLAKLDGRYQYSRFGHDTILRCVWCTDSMDYLLFSLPSTMSPFILNAVLIGVLGIESIAGKGAARRAKTWRSFSGWSLVLAAAAEVATRYFWTVRAVQGECPHLSPTINTIRTLFLILLPLLYTFLPLPPLSASPQSLVPLLSNTQNTLRLSALARSSLSRDSRLWSLQGRLSAEQSRLETATRNNEQVIEAVQHAGIEQEQIRTGAQRWITDGWSNLIKIDSDRSR
ncbi:hypothetical protein BD324DRAFT_639519 [Kockovaella imperatae]|uniref:Uncharacterized protein n=1 Tax=Kockovaella imperatae TaxID=4999 RepID=A0A1Y1U631_9TREE|nr:hypothetical protein BD324DRAFT_639519 [Kockovaella imperatae]ORX33478.1 hypothetical protein BD324DRAFT_639519 [Kockovaella imperatae]